MQHVGSLASGALAMTIAWWFAPTPDVSQGGDQTAPRRTSAHADTTTAASTSALPSVADAERLLVEGIRVGDSAAFDTLSQRYWEILWRYAHRVVRTADVADDVVQDVLFDLWQRREQIDVQRGVRAYLFKATRHRALEVLRHAQVVSRAEAAHDPIILSGTGQHVRTSAHPSAEYELEMALARVLEGIPPRRREILVLRWRYGLPHEEIAEILGLGVSAVKMQIHRATALLRPLLERVFREE